MAARGRPRKKIDNVAAEIQRQIEEWMNANNGKFVTAAEDVARMVVDEMKQKAPADTGAYRAGWTYRREERPDGYGGKFIVFVVHNRDRYQLTHLLNNGHAKRGGGWVNGDNHITKIYKTIPAKLEQAAKEAVE